jgi:hypothetical protein
MILFYHPEADGIILVVDVLFFAQMLNDQMRSQGLANNSR